MPPANNTPKLLKPYLSHGVELEWEEGKEEALGDCVWCGKNKFSVNVETGQGRCFSCSTGLSNGKVSQGVNVYTFLRLVHQQSMGQTSLSDYEELAQDRKILSVDTLVAWGVCKSFITGEWIFPGHDASGKFMQLYRYVPRLDGRGYHTQATSEIGHQVIGVPLFDEKKSQIYIAEGIWDAMVLWETLRGLKEGEDGEYSLTSNEEVSYLQDTNILAVPSCNAFEAKWHPLFAGKDITFFFDSDHPRALCKPCKKSYSTVEHEACPLCHVKDEKAVPIAPAGYSGTKRNCQILSTVDEPPKSVSYLQWGTSEDPSHDPELPSGFDVRDWLTRVEGEEECDLLTRGKNLDSLLEKVELIPKDWVDSTGGGKQGSVELQLKECREWNTLRQAYMKAMQWNDGFDIAFCCMLATVASVRMPEDQLWLVVCSAASSGKTSLCNGICVGRKWIHSVDKLKGIMSGYKSDKSGKEDFGLIPKIKDKTMIIKDADPLLKSPNLESILADLRSLYDTRMSSQYLQGSSREYTAIRATIILCGTDALRQLDDNELGQRFLTVSIMDEIDEVFEDDVCLRAIKRVARSKGFEANGKPEDQHSKEMVLAMQLCGGYVDYLRKNAARLLDEVTMSDEQERYCLVLGKFVAYMRARPPKRQKESQGREMAVRLCLQLNRLAYCLAIVMNKPAVDAEVMRRVRKVALDTSKGRTMNICMALKKHQEDGLELRTLARLTGQGHEDERLYLRFLRRIGVVTLETTGVRSSREVWKLDSKFTRMYDLVMGKQERVK